MLFPEPLRNFLGGRSPYCPNLMPERKLRHPRSKLIREDNDDLTLLTIFIMH